MHIIYSWLSAIKIIKPLWFDYMSAARIIVTIDFSYFPWISRNMCVIITTERPIFCGLCVFALKPLKTIIKWKWGIYFNFQKHTWREMQQRGFKSCIWEFLFLCYSHRVCVSLCFTISIVLSSFFCLGSRKFSHTLLCMMSIIIKHMQTWNFLGSLHCNL